MLDELFPIIGQAMDKLANQEDGQKIVDDIGTVIGRLYRNLTFVQQIPEDHAAAIIAGLGKSGGGK